MNLPNQKLRKNYIVKGSYFILVSKFVFLQIIIFSTYALINYLFTSPILTSLIFAGLDIFLSIFILLKWHFRYYIISASNIAAHGGVFMQSIKTCDLKGVRSVSIKQSLLGNLFNFGTLILENPLLEENLKLINIGNPNYHAKIIEKQRLKIIEGSSHNVVPI